jgi:hypothetical protein
VEKLRVRVYNVLFGDAILVSFPDRTDGGTTDTRHILIDVGNVPSSKPGGKDFVFQPVLKNVLQELNGQPLDLYVMTHEHLDHVQGLPCCERKFYTDSEDDLKQRLQARYAWLTASAEENYYSCHPDAKKRRLEARAAYRGVHAFVRALKASPEGIPDGIEALWMNNNYWKTDACVKYARKLAQDTGYVHRGIDLDGLNPFTEAKVSIWAPEEDTAAYYGRFRPMMLGFSRTKDLRRRPVLSDVLPPPGVDAGAFYQLVNMGRGYTENLLAIDKAANNTSVVFYLEWRDWKLLFTGDAEDRSWREMNKAKENENAEVLEPLHFLKVSHHGSGTGLPRPHILEQILPLEPHDDRPRRAVVSTFPDTYNGVPDREALEQELVPRCELTYVERGTVDEGGYEDFWFPP